MTLSFQITIKITQILSNSIVKLQLSGDPSLISFQWIASVIEYPKSPQNSKM